VNNATARAGNLGLPAQYTLQLLLLDLLEQLRKNQLGQIVARLKQPGREIVDLHLWRRYLQRQVDFTIHRKHEAPPFLLPGLGWCLMLLIFRPYNIQ
jgi:hypothetical protein